MSLILTFDCSKLIEFLRLKFTQVATQPIGANIFGGDLLRSLNDRLALGADADPPDRHRQLALQVVHVLARQLRQRRPLER